MLCEYNPHSYLHMQSCDDSSWGHKISVQPTSGWTCFHASFPIFSISLNDLSGSRI